MPALSPLNVVAYTLWAHVYTQWRYGSVGGMGGSVPMPMGLDYSAVKVAAEMLDIDPSPGDFAKIQKLERFELNRMRGMMRNGEH